MSIKVDIIYCIYKGENKGNGEASNEVTESLEINKNNIYNDLKNYILKISKLPEYKFDPKSLHPKFKVFMHYYDGFFTFDSLNNPDNTVQIDIDLISYKIDTQKPEDIWTEDEEEKVSEICKKLYTNLISGKEDED